MSLVCDCRVAACELGEEALPHDEEECEVRVDEHWMSEPEEQDLPAAETYLSLLVGPSAAATARKALKKEKELHHYAAKDILRAAQLALLAADDSEVKADLEKVKSGQKLSPVLLVQGVPLWIADGYHRVCASYYIDEKSLVACRIVPRP
jgi:hypothetical protein